jgi:hypothetical protein
MNEKLGSSDVLQGFRREILIVREMEVGRSHVVREFEFEFLTVRNTCCKGRRERISPNLKAKKVNVS